MHILALVAGTNVPSNADHLCDAFLAGVRSASSEATVTKINLKDTHIEHFTVEYYHPQCSSHDDFCKLQELVEQADGMVIATPIWNFSVPAHLKNAIDRMGAFCLDEKTRTRGMLEGTPAFFLFTGGAPKSVWKGLMRFTTSHLPESLRYYGATIIGKFYEGQCTAGKGVFGLVIDQRTEVLKRAEAAGKRFAAIVERYTTKGKLPLRYHMIMRLYRFGQRIAGKVL
jgi:multimeric flavodoxin WrbA